MNKIRQTGVTRMTKLEPP